MFKFFTSIALLIMLPTQSQAADTLQEIEQKFQGDFELVSYFQFPEQGEPIDMNYVGRLSYDALGNMAGLGMPRDLPHRNQDSDERITGGFAYWGKVSFDPENSIVIHHVEGSPMVPEWVGSDNVRHFEFSDGLLKLSLKNDSGRTTATLGWRKLN
ncbi:MAG: lipocalin-like domain-containing protein [Gammaproteobacteria bacterium]|nr:lipocalin-like domain-containing protein [Gammaproteobacteria bacterium]